MLKQVQHDRKERQCHSEPCPESSSGSSISESQCKIINCVRIKIFLKFGIGI
jgi:hypothetical protein